MTPGRSGSTADPLLLPSWWPRCGPQPLSCLGRVCWLRAAGRAAGTALPASTGAQDTRACRVWLVLLHMLPLSPAPGRQHHAEVPRGHPAVTAGPGAATVDPHSPEHAALARHHGPLGVTNGSWALGRALGTSLCQVQLKNNYCAPKL